MDQLGRMMWEERWRRGWSFNELASALGATTPGQVLKVARRLAAIEQTGERDRELLLRAFAVLEGDVALVESIIQREEERERAEYEAWLWADVPMVMYYYLGSACWGNKTLAGMTEEQAYEHVSTFAKGWRYNVGLAVNRRLTIWFRKGTGVEFKRDTLGESAPSTTIGGVEVVFRAEIGGTAS